MDLPWPGDVAPVVAAHGQCAVLPLPGQDSGNGPGGCATAPHGGGPESGGGEKLPA